MGAFDKPSDEFCIKHFGQTDYKKFTQYHVVLEYLNLNKALTQDVINSFKKLNPNDLIEVMGIIKQLKENKVQLALPVLMTSLVNSKQQLDSMHHLFEKNYLDSTNMAKFLQVTDPNFHKIIYNYTQNCPTALNKNIVNQLIEKNDSNLFMASLNMQKLYPSGIPEAEYTKLINLYDKNDKIDKSPVVVPYKTLTGSQDFIVYKADSNDTRRTQKKEILANYQKTIESKSNSYELDSYVNMEKKNKQSDFYKVSEKDNKFNPLPSNAEIAFNYMVEGKNRSFENEEKASINLDRSSR